MEEKKEQLDLFNFDKPVIKGFPELRWTGKRPYTSTQFFPAQLKETYGKPDENGWINKIFWGDNLQVMSHLLKKYRGKIDLIYIDPPFDSKADYKKKIKLKGKEITNDSNAFEEKQYGDIWTNDEYLQFMYERLILLRELLSDKGSIYVHCDYHRSHQLRCLMDEIFGTGCVGVDKNAPGFRAEIIWDKGFRGTESKGIYQRTHDTIFWYTKTSNWIWNQQYEEYKDQKMGRYNKVDEEGRNYALIKRVRTDGSVYYGKCYPNESGKKIEDVIFVPIMASTDSERLDYPTQKPEELIDKLILSSSNNDSIVFDCFMGSGTTQAVAMKFGRRFIGADINLGAVQTTTKRLLNILKSNEGLFEKNKAGFEVYNVNNYDFFRNPIEARDLLIEALNIQPFSASNIFDGELDGRNVKILPVNRIATKADLGELVANLPYKSYEKKQDENQNDVVDRITLVCMGHEPDLVGAFKDMVGKYNVDVELVDILLDKSNLEFKRDSTADVRLKGHTVEIRQFFPMNLMQKLSLQKENVDNWTQLVESVMIDYDYDGNVLKPQIIDIPDKNSLVKGKYDIPNNHGRIKIKITDLLSESLEVEVK